MSVLKAFDRTEAGTSKTRKLRKEGKIPGILYGHGKKPVMLSFDSHDMEFAIQHGERLLELDHKRKKINALIKEVQYDAFGTEILHVDLTRVDLDERVQVTVPVILVGTPEGVKEGGVLQQTTSAVTVDVSVVSIPDEIKIVVSSLKLNDQLHLSDIELPEGAEMLDNPEDQLCVVAMIAEEVEVEEAEEEAPAEPEVIGEKKADDEQETAEEE